MVSAIDFCKNFLTQYFNKKDVDATEAFLADDVIWITPNEIRHFRSAQSVHAFLVSSMGDDPNAYNVDYAATLSVPNLGSASLAVFEINLIPKHEESSINLRVTLGLQPKGETYELVYVGMSRRYQRTDVEQIRGFADALPGGVMTLTCVRKEVRLMYANAFFYNRLGYDEATFYEKIGENTFFMLSYEEQKRMQTLVAEMSALSRPKPLSMQVTLLGSDTETQVPCHMTITAAYKEGDSTVLYLLFDELSDVKQEFERQQRRQERLWRQEQKELAAQTTAAAQTPEGDILSQKDLDELIAEIRRDAEKRIAAVEMAANVHVEEAQKLASDEAEAAERLIRAKLEEAAAAQDAAVEQARKEVRSQFSAAWKKEKEKLSARQRSLEEELQQSREEARKAAEVIAALQAQQSEKETAAQQQAEQAQERIRQLEEELQKAQEASARQQEELQTQEAARKEQESRQEAAQQASDRAFAQQEQELASVRSELQQARVQAASKEAELSDTIAQQQTELKNQQLALRKKEADSAVLSKEKDKSIRRMESLLQGQLQSVRSIAGAAGRERKPEELRRQMAKIAGITQNLPDYIGDLTAIAALNPAERRVYEDRFAVSDCLDLARAVIRPQCRTKGIIFSVESTPGMPDKVVGSKAGLELSFLCVLENAVQYTLGGGQITLRARSENAVRGSVYYCFTVSDTGQGIPEDRLAGLFDNPESELYVARTVIASMGGSIQVRSKEGEGTTFEIRVSLKLQ